MKKVLIIAYYWPPSAGSGVQRWLKFVKYLRDYGWEPIVYTPLNPDFDLTDEALLAQVPASVQVLKRPIFEPFKVYELLTRKKAGQRVNAVYEKGSGGIAQKLALWLRSNVFIPDARMLFIRPSIAWLSRWLKQNQIDAVVSTGPPHSMHLIARALHQKTGLPWLADFRDPWTRIDYFAELDLAPWALRRHQRLEKSVLTQANAVTVVGRTMAQEFAEMVPGLQAHVITNGFDPPDFEIDQPVQPDAAFSIAHVGMLGKARNHPVFWQALKELCASHPAFASQLQIHFYGKIDADAQASATASGLQDKVFFNSYLPHAQAIAVQRKAAVLLLSVNNTHNAKGILTGKLFEYLALARPILAIGPPDGDAAHIINSAGAGLVSDFDDLEGLKRNLLQLFEQHQQGRGQVSPQGINAYSRPELTRRMAQVLDQIVASAPAPKK